MAYKVLGQSNPSATSLTDVYTVPGSGITGAVLSSIVVANRGAATTFRVSVAVGGAGDDNKQYLAYDTPITDNDIVVLTLGVTLATGDVVRVYAGAARLSFNIFGEETA